ncbi:MAG: hypothetical protein AB7T49_15105 [Oligoflexales bacterium]
MGTRQKNSLFVFVALVMFAATPGRAVEGQVQILSTERFEKIRGELHNWERSVRGFRRDHNLSLVGGYTQNTWTFREHPKISQAQIEAQYAQADYTFHLQLFRSLGYYLGSSIGYQAKEKSDDPEVATFRTYTLPGLKMGLVLNPHPILRLSSGLSLNLDRIERLKGPASPDGTERRSISITTRVLGFHFASDFFFQLPWAVRVEFETRTVYYSPIASNTDSPLRISFGKAEKRLGIGIVYHLI